MPWPIDIKSTISSFLSTEEILKSVINDDDAGLLLFFLDSGVSVNAKISDKTMLQYAVGLGKIHSVKVLLSCGAKFDRADEYGDTELILAAEKGYLAVVEALVSYGAKVEHSDIVGTNALRVAHGNRAEFPSSLIHY